MFDERIIGRGIIISSSDFVDWALADIRYDDANIGRSGLLSDVLEAAGCIAMNIGLVLALI